MKRFLLYFLFVTTAFTAAAQPPEDGQKRGEKIRALYIAYVQQELQFTPDEAQRFWPVHAQYERELMEVNNSNLSELDKQQRFLDIKRKYQPQFERIIGPERTNRFYPVHDRFITKLADMRQKRQERQVEKAEGIRPNGGGMRPGLRNGGGGIKRDRER